MKKFALFITLSLLVGGLLYIGHYNLPDIPVIPFSRLSPHTVIYYDHNGDTIQVWDIAHPPSKREGYVHFTDLATGKEVTVYGDLVIIER